MPTNNPVPNLMKNMAKLAKKTAKSVAKVTKEVSKKVERVASKKDKRTNGDVPDSPYSPPKNKVRCPESHSLPIIWPQKKNKHPWYFMWTRAPERISLTTEGFLRFQIVKDCHGLDSGAAFRCNPNLMLPADAATLSYSVFFPPDFNFVKGGKLPGVNIGCDPMDCSTGGSWSETGGSFRIMFRENGTAIGYAYMPLPGAGYGAFDSQPDEFKSIAQVKGKAGIDMWYGRRGQDLQLQAGRWNTVSISVRLNTPAISDGAVAVTINGKTRAMDGILWRLKEDSKINAVNFVTFFGGGTDDWNSPVDTYVCYKDIAFAAA